MNIHKSMATLFISSLILFGSVLNLRALDNSLEEGIAQYQG